MVGDPIIHGGRNIGDARLLPAARVVGDRGVPVEIIRTQGNDDRAQLLTVTITGSGVYETEGAADPAAPRGPIVAIVEWGIRGAQAKMEVDLPAGGVVFSLVASDVRVSARYDGLLTLGGLPVDGEAVPGGELGPKPRVGAMIGYGSYGQASRLTRTVRFEDMAPPGGGGGGSEVPLRIPSFAKHVLVSGRDLQASAYVVELFGFRAGPPLSTVSFAIGQAPAAIELPGDCGSIDLRNLGPGTIGTPALVFEICV